MGQLVDGVWNTAKAAVKSSKGPLGPTVAAYRGWLTKDGANGPHGHKGFKAELGRYHLYVSLGCPFAHRVMVSRALKGLDKQLPVSVVSPVMLEHGWTFDKKFPATTGDQLHPHNKYLYELYTRANPELTGRVTVPTLWDAKENTLVNLESADLIRMMNDAFDDLGARPGDYYPKELRRDIDEVNKWVADAINFGVYKAGFALNQKSFDKAVDALFAALDRVEDILSKQRYLTGPIFTEADIRLWTTLVRFDHAYVVQYRCDRKRIAEYPNVSGFLREVYQMPGIAETVNMDHIRAFYFLSAAQTNPNGIVPQGPAYDWNAEHDRDRFPAEEL